MECLVPSASRDIAVTVFRRARRLGSMGSIFIGFARTIRHTKQILKS